MVRVGKLQWIGGQNTMGKGYSEAVNKWRSDNIMTKKKNDRTNNDIQNATQKN